MPNVAHFSISDDRLTLSLLFTGFSGLNVACADGSQGAVSISDLETIPREDWPDILQNIEHYNILPFNGANQDEIQEQYSIDHLN